MGDINGRSYWTRGGATMSWTGTGWEIITASGSYFSGTDVASPISITSPMWVDIVTGKQIGRAHV